MQLTSKRNLMVATLLTVAGTIALPFAGKYINDLARAPVTGSQKFVSNIIDLSQQNCPAQTALTAADQTALQSFGRRAIYYLNDRKIIICRGDLETGMQAVLLSGNNTLVLDKKTSFVNTPEIADTLFKKIGTEPALALVNQGSEENTLVINSRPGSLPSDVCAGEVCFRPSAGATSRATVPVRDDSKLWKKLKAQGYHD